MNSFKTVFKVAAINLEALHEGTYINTHFSSFDKAWSCLKSKMQEKRQHNVSNELVDKEGNEDVFPIKGNPAVYYTSNFGSYKCAIYIETIKIYS